MAVEFTLRVRSVVDACLVDMIRSAVNYGAKQCRGITGVRIDSQRFMARF